MGLTTLDTWTFAGKYLQPMQRPEDARQDAVAWGANLSIEAGRAVAIKTSDKKAYAYVAGASDGTENAVGFSMYSFTTDANGKVFLAGTAAASIVNGGPWSTAPIWVGGIFDPSELRSTSSLIAQVNTLTPGSVEVDDVFTITATDRVSGRRETLSFTATAATAANVSAGLIALWNASTDPIFTGVTASGSTTIVLTADTAGVAIPQIDVAASNGSSTDDQTFTVAFTTANSGVPAALVTSLNGRILHNGFLKF